jgi:hypothetical protein
MTLRYVCSNYHYKVFSWAFFVAVHGWCHGAGALGCQWDPMARSHGPTDDHGTQRALPNGELIPKTEFFIEYICTQGTQVEN